MAEDNTEKVKVVDKAPAPKYAPKLDSDVASALEMRKAKKAVQPRFRRQEWFRYKKLGEAWRRPKGGRSKQRRGLKYRVKRVKIGFRGPRLARGIHPSGFREVLVYNTKDLEKLDPAVECARIGGTVGGRKREAIVAKADELGIKILNRGGL